MSQDEDRSRPRTAPRLRVWHIRLYEVCDGASGALILVLTVLSPWWFGSTQPPVIRLMNWLSYGLGSLLMLKLLVRNGLGFKAATWNAGRPSRSLQWLQTGLAILTAVLLGWCAVSALNARALWVPEQAGFDYYDCISWLPHSLDRARTWEFFRSALAWACFFWAVVDWLPGLTAQEQRVRRRLARGEPMFGAESALPLPGRLRLLLWALCLNGGVLAVQGIAQRISGTGELLWLVEPRVNKGPETFFGPYAYRASAAQYFNLVWPVCLGFWWTLQRRWGFRRWSHQWLLLSAILMAACPVISTSRGGALVMWGLLGLSGLVLILSPALLRARSGLSPVASLITFGLVCGFLAASLWLGLELGWQALDPRMNEIEASYVYREQMYETAARLLDDYPWLGIGPGAFEAVFQLYRRSPDDYWPAQLHNDWMELRIMFGNVGFCLILLALGLVLVRWWVAGGVHGGRRFIVFFWLALAGCLMHARFDMPFRIYSVTLLFLLLCAVLFVLTRKGAGGESQ
jgi:O-antigen ligase